MSVTVSGNPAPIRVRDLPGMKSSITFSDEFTPISKPPVVPQDKVTLQTHSNVYHPSQLHAGHHRKPSPSPDHSSIKGELVFNEKEPVSVFMHSRRPSASPDPCQVRSLVSASPTQQPERVPLHRKPSPVTTPTSNIIAHNTSQAPAEVAHKKPAPSAAAAADHSSSMRSLVTQAPIENSVRRVRASPGGTDHIVLG